MRNVPTGRAALLRGVLRSVAMLLAAVALAARPAPRDDGSGSGDMVIVIDVSMSMMAADLAPSRLAETQRQVLGHLHTARPSRAAVVVFAGDVRVVCPLTTDLAAVADSVAGVSPEAAASGGSDVASALENAARLLEESRGRRRAVLLASDGEPGPADEREPFAIVRTLATDGIALTVIAVGTAAGAAVPLRRSPGSFVSADDGGLRLSKRNDRRLAAIAAAAAGDLVELEAGGAFAVAETEVADTRGAAGAERLARWLTLSTFAVLLADAAIWWLRPASNPWR